MAENQYCLCAQRFPRKKRRERGRGGPAAQLRPTDFGCGGAGRRGAEPSGLKAAGILCTPPPGGAGFSLDQRGNSQVCSESASGQSDLGRRGRSKRGQVGLRQKDGSAWRSFWWTGDGSLWDPKGLQIRPWRRPRVFGMGRREEAGQGSVSQGGYLNGVQDLGPCLWRQTF